LKIQQEESKEYCNSVNKLLTTLNNSVTTLKIRYLGPLYFVIDVVNNTGHTSGGACTNCVSSHNQKILESGSWDHNAFEAFAKDIKKYLQENYLAYTIKMKVHHLEPPKEIFGIDAVYTLTPKL